MYAQIRRPVVPAAICHKVPVAGQLRNPCDFQSSMSPFTRNWNAYVDTGRSKKTEKRLLLATRIVGHEFPTREHLHAVAVHG